MDELIKTFHIEVNLLLAQMVNFIIVLLVLYKFAYKPILKTLNDRTKKIEKGLKDSVDASQKLEEMTEKEKEILARAKKEAQAIIKNAETAALRNTENTVAEIKEQSEKMLLEASKQIEQEKKKIMLEVKSEIANLAILATEKIITEKLDIKKDKEFIEKSIK